MDASVIYDIEFQRNLNMFLLISRGKTARDSYSVNARYSSGLGSMANIFFFGGPQIAFNVGARNFEWTNGSNYALKKK